MCSSFTIGADPELVLQIKWKICLCPQLFYRLTIFLFILKYHVDSLNRDAFFNTGSLSLSTGSIQNEAAMKKPI